MLDPELEKKLCGESLARSFSRLRHREKYFSLDDAWSDLDRSASTVSTSQLDSVNFHDSGEAIMHVMRGAVLIVLALISSEGAQAFVDAPVLIPAKPAAGDLVSISVTAGVCDLMGGAPAGVTTQGNVLDVLLQSANSVDSEECTFPIFATTYPIGRFAAGPYTMHVDRIYAGNNGAVSENIGNLSFTVADVPGIPTLGRLSVSLLSTFIIFGALIAIRRRN